MNIRTKTITLLEETGELHHIGFGNDFLNMTDWISSKLKLLFMKGHYQLSKKATHVMGITVCQS